jgi:hypothetical protein
VKSGETNWRGTAPTACSNAQRPNACIDWRWKPVYELMVRALLVHLLVDRPIVSSARNALPIRVIPAPVTDRCRLISATSFPDLKETYDRVVPSTREPFFPLKDHPCPDTAGPAEGDPERHADASRSD